MKEIWKDVFEYEEIYKVSNLGNIKSLDRIIIRRDGTKYVRYGQIINPRIGKDGSVRVNLNKDAIKRVHSLARVVYKAFNPDFNYYDDSLIIIHKNNKGEDNELENLSLIRRKNAPNLIIGNEWEETPIKCITTNKTFERIADAGRYYNVNAGSISGCCQKRYPSAGKIILDDGTEYKLIWRYL